MSEPNSWEIAGAIASVISALAAAAGLAFLGWQIRAATKSSDLNSLVEFSRAVDEQERALAIAVRDTELDETAKTEAFHSLLNLLEMYAGAHNRRLLQKTSCDFVRDKLLDAHILIEDVPYWRDTRAKAMLNPATFAEWETFVARHRAELTSRRRELAELSKRERAMPDTAASQK